ncbi:MAG TPA: iron-containing alcohol dehydrogenase [Firmicutes bacterium]|nr:iron-containing alcohol dehydrogenase [Bacillota bacterium]
MLEFKNNFQFYTPTKIIFGPDSFRAIGDYARGLGKKALVITCRFWFRERTVLKHLSNELNRVKIRHLFFEGVLPEPTTAAVNRAVSFAESENVDLIIGLGGGSVIDVGKATAIMIKNHGRVDKFLEIDGNYELKNKGVPYIAVPTTAGTGSEVTRNAVLLNPKSGVKRSLRSEYMFPDIAVIDPVLSLSMSRELSAFTGLDALVHLIEGFISVKSNHMTDILGLHGIELIKRNLISSCSRKSEDINVYSNLAFASLVGGLMLSNSGMGICHALAGGLAGKPGFTHSTAVAFLLPVVLDYLSDKSEKAVTVIKHLIAYKEDKNILDWFRYFYKRLGISDELGRHTITHHDQVEIAAAALNTSSIKGSPVQITKKCLLNILNNAVNFYKA